MRYWIRRGLMATALLSGAPVRAEDGKLDVDFYLRARVETIDNQFRPNAPTNDTALLLRTQIAAEYDAGPIRIGGEIIDSRAYFQRRHSTASTTEINALEPVQAYIRSDFSNVATATLGRFAINQGSRRLIARSAYRNDINAFTGARLDLKDKAGDQALLFWTLPQTRLPDDIDGLNSNAVELDRERIGLQFFGASATTRRLGGAATLEVYLYRLAEHDAPGILTRDRRLWTPGLRLYRAPAAAKTDFELEAAWQGGTERGSTRADDLTDLPVSAWFAHAHVGHSFTTRWSPRLVAQVDIASGDGRSRTYGRFDPLFGARVFEFGPSSLYGPVSRSNLVGAEARVEVTPDKRWDGYLAAGPLWLYSRTDSFSGTGVRDPAGKSGSYAGTQVDLRARYWITPKHVRLALGYANLFKGAFLEHAPGAPATGDTHYGFGEVTLTL